MRRNAPIGTALVWLLLAWGTVAAGTGPTGASGGRGGPPPDQILVRSVAVTVAAHPSRVGSLEALALAVVGIAPGDVLVAERLSAAAERLTATGLFDRVAASKPARPAVHFDLTAAPLIKTVAVSGAFPLFEKEVKAALGFGPGDRFRPGLLAKPKEKLTALFVDQGYPEPRVTVSGRVDPKDGYTAVSVAIDKGPYERIERVDVVGNRAVGDRALLARTDVWKYARLPGPMRRFNRHDLEEDAATLVRVYREKGYADVAVEPVVERDRERRRVRVTFRVDEGPGYQVRFTGNAALSDGTLEKELVLFDKGNRSRMGERRSLRRIRRKYRDEGYFQATVRMRAETVDDAVAGAPVRRLEIQVAEGPQGIVESVTIEGNAAVGNDDIRGQMLTRPPVLTASGVYVARVLKEDLASVEALYRGRGFFKAAVSQETDWSQDPDESGRRLARITLSIDEGPRTTVRRVELEGVPPETAAAAKSRLSVKTGQVLRLALLPQDESMLAEHLSGLGYPHVRVESRLDVATEDTRADVAYLVTPGQRVTAGPVVCVGNFRTANRLLLRRMGLAAGDPFSRREVLASAKRIRDLGLFETVRIRTPGLDSGAAVVPLVVEVVEKKAVWAETSIGYDTERLAYGVVKAGHDNIFGSNRAAGISAEASQIGYLVDLSLTDHNLFGTATGATGHLFAENREELNQSFGTRSAGATLAVGRPFTSRWTASLGLTAEQREQYRVDDTPIPEGEEDNYKQRSILTLSPTVVYNSSDSYVRPRKGLRAILHLDYSDGIEDALDDFVKYQADLRGYFSLGKRLTLALRGAGGSITDLRSESDIPEDQQFYLGGISSVRGFAENKLRTDDDGTPLGGTHMVLGSVEARIDTGTGLEVALFTDAGALVDAPDDLDAGALRHTAGLGLRYLTPIGPVGLIYGYKLDRREGEDAGQLHFSIGYSF